MDTRDLSVIIYTLWPWYNGFGLMCVSSFNILSYSFQEKKNGGGCLLILILLDLNVEN